MAAWPPIRRQSTRSRSKARKRPFIVRGLWIFQEAAHPPSAREPLTGGQEQPILSNRFGFHVLQDGGESPHSPPSGHGALLSIREPQILPVAWFGLRRRNPLRHSRIAAMLAMIAAGVCATTPNEAQKTADAIRRVKAARSWRPM